MAESEGQKMTDLTVSAEHEWKVQSLRCTWIQSNHSGGSEPSTWFEAVLGEPATSQRNQPKLKIYEEEAPFAGGKLILARVPGRIDWILSPEPSESEFPPLWPLSLGTMDKQLGDLLAKWLPHAPPVGRIAVAAGLIMSAANGADATSRLKKFVPSLNSLDVSSRTSDLFYRINRPRDSSHLREPGSGEALSAVAINRVSSWAVIQARQLNVTISDHVDGTPQAPQIALGAPPSFLLRCDLDVNNAASSAGDIPKEKWKDVLEEVRTMMLEIATKGEIP